MKAVSSPLKPDSIPKAPLIAFTMRPTEEQRSCTLSVPPYVRQENHYGGEKRML